MTLLTPTSGTGYRKPCHCEGQRPVAIRSPSGPFGGRAMRCIAGDADCHAALRLAMTFFSLVVPSALLSSLVLVVAEYYSPLHKHAKRTSSRKSFSCFLFHLRLSRPARPLRPEAPSWSGYRHSRPSFQTAAPAGPPAAGRGPPAPGSSDCSPRRPGS